jgi:hypothetical protein
VVGVFQSLQEQRTQLRCLTHETATWHFDTGVRKIHPRAVRSAGHKRVDRE